MERYSLPPKELSVLISAYASSETGTGHLRRMMRLAEGLLSESNVTLSFHTSALGSKILATSFLQYQLSDVYIVPPIKPGAMLPESDSLASVDDLTKRLPLLTPDILILDNYSWSSVNEEPLRKYCEFLVVYDDLARTSHSCDLLINQNANVDASAYDGLVEHSCELAVGARFALIASPFTRIRAVGLPTPEARSQNDQVFISLGGGDPNQDLLRIVSLVLKKTQLSASVATGSHISDVQALSDLAVQFPDRLDLRLDSDVVAEQMNLSGFALASGGTMIWERAVLGLPSLCLIVADNQLDACRWMEARALHDVFDLRGAWSEADLLFVLNRYVLDRARRRIQSATSASLVGIHGVANTAEMIIRSANLKFGGV